jgi:hypothetical protein
MKNRPLAFLILALTGVTACAGTGGTAPKGILPIPDYSGDFWSRSFLTGDWDGARTRLANKGIQFNVDWVQTVQSVVDGGRDTILNRVRTEATASSVVVLDLSAAPHVDMHSAHMLAELAEELEEAGARLQVVEARF